MRRFLFGLAGFAGFGPQARRRFAPPKRALPVRPPAAGGLRPSPSACSSFWGAARLQKPSFSANPPVFPASDTGLRQNTAGRQR